MSTALNDTSISTFGNAKDQFTQSTELLLESRSTSELTVESRLSTVEVNINNLTNDMKNFIAYMKTQYPPIEGAAKPQVLRALPPRLEKARRKRRINNQPPYHRTDLASE